MARPMANDPSPFATLNHPPSDLEIPNESDLLSIGISGAWRLQCIRIGGETLLSLLKRWPRQKLQKLVFVLFEPLTKRLLWEFERANLSGRDVAVANPLAVDGFSRKMTRTASF
jgi:hypothetical protein